MVVTFTAGIRAGDIPSCWHEILYLTAEPNGTAVWGQQCQASILRPKLTITYPPQSLTLHNYYKLYPNQCPNPPHHRCETAGLPLLFPDCGDFWLCGSGHSWAHSSAPWNNLIWASFTHTGEARGGQIEVIYTTTSRQWLAVADFVLS